MKTIPLSRGKEAIVDEDDYARLSQYKWHAVSNGKGFRAQTRVRGRTLYMHREILGATKAPHIDHINGDSLDNRKQNLRACTLKQNIRNARKQSGTSSRFKGVCFDRGKWKAYITVDGHCIHLGMFNEELDAAKCYANAARLNFGEFARHPGVTCV